MDNVIAERVKTASLTKAQYKIADYFIRNPERVGMCSSMEVAKEIGVSDASITRFARAIGYDGFTDLKNDIYNNMAMKATGGINSLSLAERFTINRAKYSEGSSRGEYMKVLQYNLERTFQQNEEETFEKTVDMLIQAKHRYVIGFRGCLGVSTQFAWLLRFLLDHVVTISEEGPGGIGSLQDIGAEDCVVFFSLSRYYKSDVKLAELAHRRGAKICLVTNSVLSPLASMADILLLVEVEHASFFNSAASLNMLAEYLITRVAEQRVDHYHDRAGERDDITKELRL